MSEVRLCPCHGEPMYHEKRQTKSGGQWRCAVQKRAWERLRYRERWGNPEWVEKRRVRQREIARRVREKRADEGRCTRCGADDPIGSHCWKCLNEMEVHRVVSL